MTKWILLGLVLLVAFPPIGVLFLLLAFPLYKAAEGRESPTEFLARVNSSPTPPPAFEPAIEVQTTWYRTSPEPLDESPQRLRDYKGYIVEQYTDEFDDGEWIGGHYRVKELGTNDVGIRKMVDVGIHFEDQEDAEDYIDQKITSLQQLIKPQGRKK